MQKVFSRWLKAIPVFVYLVVFTSGVVSSFAQQMIGGPDQNSGSDQGAGQVSIQGTVVDQRGLVVQGASVTSKALRADRSAEPSRII